MTTDGNSSRGPAIERLVSALQERQNKYVEAIDELLEIAHDRSEEEAEEVYELTRLLREAVELTGCLRRLVPACTLQSLHRAFGAPGDFGYETPIGDALSRLYRGEL